MYSVTQICPTLLQAQGLYPIRLHGILQARILEQVAISSARGSSWPRDWLWVFLTFICNYSLYINIIQARLQQYREQYCELPDVQTGFRKGRRTRDQISNICWIIKKQESFRKTSISTLLTMSKPLTVWTTTNSGKFLKRWEYQTAWPASWEICMQV